MQISMTNAQTTAQTAIYTITSASGAMLMFESEWGSFETNCYTSAPSQRRDRVLAALQAAADRVRANTSSPARRPAAARRIAMRPSSIAMPDDLVHGAGAAQRVPARTGGRGGLGIRNFAKRSRR